MAQVIGNVCKAAHWRNELGEVIHNEIAVDAFYIALELKAQILGCCKKASLKLFFTCGFNSIW